MDKPGLNRAERISSGVLIAFGLFVAYYSHHYLKLGRMIIPGAGFLPFCIGIVLTVLGVAWYVKTLLARRAPSKAGAGGAAAVDAAVGAEPARSLVLTRLLPGILLVVLYAWFFERAGYILSTVLFMVGYGLGLGGTVSALIFLFVLFNGVLDRWAQPIFERLRA